MSAKLLTELANDAAATVGRLRDDAQHLRSVAKHGAKVVKQAARETHRKIEQGIESAADQLIKLTNAAKGAQSSIGGVKLERGRGR